MPELVRCIYCLRDLGPAAFNREHVIPESFGLYGPDTFVLHDTVCLDCNSYFGNHLELFWGRDSLEGYLRYRFGVAERSKKFRPRRIVFTLADDGAWKGTLLTVTGFANDGKMLVDFVPQVAFHKKGTDEKKHFLIEEVPTATELAAQGYDCSKIEVLGPDDSSRQAVASSLKELGYTMEKWQEGPRYLEDGKPNHRVPVEVSGKIDHTIKRTVAKIAMNYAAHAHGQQFVLGADFNAVRDYIRHQTAPSWEVVSMDNQPVLQNDPAGTQHVARHLITLNWDAAHRGIFAEVSFFNAFRYTVRLCNRFTGIFREVRSGHAFDLETKTVSKLIGLDKKITVIKGGRF